MSRRTARRRASPTPARLRVRRPEDFIGLIPYLLGFHPDTSVVVVFSRHRRVLLTARMDLPPPALVVQLAEHVAALVRQHEVEDVVLAVYADDLGPARQVLDRLVRDSVVPVREALQVGAGRWWSLCCDSGCCPPEGRPYDPDGHPLAAEAVYAGLSACPDRAALRRQVSGPDADQVRQLAEPLRAARRRTDRLPRSEAAALMADTVRRCLDDDEGPGDADCLLLAVLAEDVVVRDVAWALVRRRDRDEHLRLWSQVVMRAPVEVASAPLGLLGVVAWICGLGALQNCCVERLEEIDPAYTLGALLADISERALPPSAWDEMAADLRREVSAVAGLSGLH